MEEMEVPTEHLHETIQEHAEKEKWALYVALSTAFMAVLAAVAGLLAGHHSNEALIEQVKASDQWSYYQAKSIKAELTQYSIATIQALGGKENAGIDNSKLAQYEKDKEEIKVKAETHEKNSEEHLAKHVTIARSVTLFQIAIAISAISILTRKKILWFIAMALSCVGIVFFIAGTFAV